MPRLKHPDEELVYACPFCDGPTPYRRTHVNRDYDEPVICHECDATFRREFVVERESRHDPQRAAAASRRASEPESDIGQALVDASPDAIGGRH